MPALERLGVPRWVPVRARSRWFAALACGILAALAQGPAPISVRLLVGWGTCALILLIFAWGIIVSASPVRTRARAAADDPGRHVVHLMVAASSVLSVLGVVAMLSDGSASTSARLFGFGAIVPSWLVLHTYWALRYAHLHYRDAGARSGLSFPGDAPPDDFDFAYFSFTIGMCFQVSDVSISSPLIRRAVLVHAISSFVVNTAVIALVLNLVVSSLRVT